MRKRAKQIAKQIKKINFKKVQTWAEEGDIQAQFILAYAYRTGERLPHSNYKISDEWKEKIAKQNEFFAEKYMPEYFGRKKLKISELFVLAALQSHFGDYVKPNGVEKDMARSKIYTEYLKLLDAKEKEQIKKFFAKHHSGKAI